MNISIKWDKDNPRMYQGEEYIGAPTFREIQLYKEILRLKGVCKQVIDYRKKELLNNDSKPYSLLIEEIKDLT